MLSWSILLSSLQVNPYLECVIEINPDALAIAAILDEERRAGKIRGPLHGVPVLVKDVSTCYGHPVIFCL